jgi:hypothetical protein
MTAKQTAKQIVSNISSFCKGCYDRNIPSTGQTALVRSIITELQEYRAVYYANGCEIQALPSRNTVYTAATPKQAQEIADAFSTYV